MNRQLLFGILSLLGGMGIGYYFGYDIGFEKGNQNTITTFEECLAAGYPVAESYPEQCRTPDGKIFIRDVSLPIPSHSLYPIEGACTMDAKLCPDGSSVGRVAPNCEFAPCSGD